MITINGRTFARNKAEAAKNLFNPGGTVTGFYKLVKGGLVLMDMQRNPRAAVCGSRDFLGIVSCGKDGNGKLFYQYALSNSGAIWLGFSDPDNTRENSETAESILSQIGRDRMNYYAITDLGYARPVFPEHCGKLEQEAGKANCRFAVQVEYGVVRYLLERGTYGWQTVNSFKAGKRAYVQNRIMPNILSPGCPA